MVFLNKVLKGKPITWLMVIAIVTGCNPPSRHEPHQLVSDDIIVQQPDSLPQTPVVLPPQVHPLEETMRQAGLVDVQTLEPSLVVDLKYASEDNFMRRNVYQGMQKAFLQPEVAQMLALAQGFLKQADSTLSLIVYDAARPQSVQQQMWDALDAPFEEKIKFLSNPANGSTHNFGAAVDVGIVNQHGMELDMGTPFDYMGELAYPAAQQRLLASGHLTLQQLENRKLLHSIMNRAGFSGIQTEWWHFNAMSRQQARQRYPIIE